MPNLNKWSILYLFGWTFAVVASSLWYSDPDVFWHLKVGEWIVKNNAVIRTDVFSWSVYGEPWTAHQWLWDVLLYSVHKNFGFYGMWALTFIMGFTCGALIRGGLKLRGVSEAAATAAGGLGILLLIGWLKPWPQVGMYVMFSLYLFLSLRNRWGPREIFYAAGIGMLWANIHSTAVMFPLLLLAEVGYKLIFKRDSLEDIKWRLGAVVSAAAATLVNPHFFGLWTYAVEQGLLTGLYRQHITSWMPYIFRFNLLSLIFFISALILFAAVRQGKEKEMEFIRAAGFWALALMSRIYSPFAILSTAVLFGLLKFKLEAASIKRLAILSLLAGLVALPVRGIPTDMEEVARKNNYPVDVIEFIESEGLEKIYNDHGWGGYLIWKDIPVYIDGRNDVYQDILVEISLIHTLEQPVGRSIKETGAQTVLTRVSGLFDVALRESAWWEEVYRDETAVVYVRQ